MAEGPPGRSGSSSASSRASCDVRERATPFDLPEFPEQALPLGSDEALELPRARLLGDVSADRRYGRGSPSRGAGWALPWTLPSGAPSTLSTATCVDAQSNARFPRFSELQHQLADRRGLSRARRSFEKREVRRPESLPRRIGVVRRFRGDPLFLAPSSPVAPMGFGSTSGQRAWSRPSKSRNKGR